MKRFILAPGVVALSLSCVAFGAPSGMPDQPLVAARSAPLIKVKGLIFRDLNRNGRLDRYEDWRLAPEVRADDLIRRMTLPEKAGTMLHAVARGDGSRGGEPKTGYDLAASEDMIGPKHITSMLTRIAVMPRVLAEQNNALQEIAERQRLGIPMTISTDPRSHFNYTAGASTRNLGFSQWPETLGMGALGDAELVKRFADVARQEYRATGITMALSPQADIATEPRWGRFVGTFGSDPDMIASLTGAYVEGFQGGRSGSTPSGVVTVVKHWVGYGAAAENGWDSHNYYGRYSAVQARSLPLHLKPFQAAFAAGVDGVMPTYSILRDLELNGKKIAPVGAAFNRDMINGLLRTTYGFKGLVVSDWRITADCTKQCEDGAPFGEKPDPEQFGMPWGVANLTVEQRFAKAIAAGVDSFGGVDTTDALVRAITVNKVPMARINAAVRRILVPKFRQGLFEDPYVDPERAGAFVGNPELLAEGRLAQARATVLLKNSSALLPLATSVKRVWAFDVKDEAMRAAGFEPVDDLAQADVAIIRAATPFQRQHPNYLFGSLHFEGDLDFKPDNPARIALERARAAGKPAVLVVSLNRPAILTDLEPKADAIVAAFGISDTAMFEVLRGKVAPRGKLPFNLPRSMDAVRTQSPDLPNDDRDPLYPFGFSLPMPAQR